MFRVQGLGYRVIRCLEFRGMRKEPGTVDKGLRLRGGRVQRSGSRLWRGTEDRI